MLLPYLLVALFQQSQATLVKTNLGLKVKRGQSAFLQEGDLQFQVPKAKDGCKVEVVQNEPITQRVGKLSPEVFDCHYLADEVKYVHNGCPILKEDTIILRLYTFTEIETYSELFTLRVEIMEPDCNVIRFGPQNLEVSEFYGLSNVLDGNVVSFHHEQRQNVECTVHVTTLDTHLPCHGQLVTGTPENPEGPRGDEPDSFVLLRQQLDNKARAHCRSDDCLNGLKLLKITKVSCSDFLLMGIRYHHTDPPSPDIDYIAIRLDLTDIRSRSIIQSEQAWIPVTIKEAVPNQSPKPAFMSTFILEVDQFILTPLSTATLDAVDEETPKQRLIFNTTKPPKEGFLTHISDHTKPISSFTWTDLNDILISYQPPNSSYTQRRNYEVEFEVHDFYFEKSQPMMVHFSIRTADTNAPRVSWNMGISLLEGQSRPISWDHLQIVDNDNPSAVKVISVDGLQHGRLTVRGGKSFLFTIKDIKDGVVHYHHDDSDTTKDYIIFRITDGSHQTRQKFPINILPKDDSPPFLITNMVLELSEGQTSLMGGSVLQACDLDSSDDYIMFNITRNPQAGEIMKMPGPGITGYPVTRFLQKDLFHSIIYYRHSGKEVFDDSFEVVLSDFHDPPNLSDPQVIVIQIQSVSDQPPQEAPGVTRYLVVNETDVVYLTKQQLEFVDVELPDSELTYTVTTPPFYTTSYGGSDAGRLFLVDSVPKLKKDPNTPMLRLFTQHAVNFLKVAYMPPMLDVGPFPQHIQFVLSVTNQQGSTTTGICFNVTVLPVDNQPPEVYVSQLSVDEGGERRLSEDHIHLTDQDSLEDSLHVELKTGPQHGHIVLNGSPMNSGQSFTMRDLKSLKVRYQHDSSETETDEIGFLATDGINSADFTLHVKVRLVNDEVPVLVSGLKHSLDCSEGHEVVITREYICATDPDSDESTLTYLIARQPYHGVVQRNGIVVDRFIQADITSGVISYRHTGQEIGLQPRHDTITFVISDDVSAAVPSCCEGQNAGISAPHLQASSLVYDLKVTVFPVNNQPPALIVGSVFVVDEGGTASLSLTHFEVKDPDSAPEDLVLLLVGRPQFGYVENILPTPGFEKSNMGISITSFTYRDVLNGNINYVQSRHQKLEPTTDQLMLCVSDGRHQSSSLTLYIVINPTNDEIPEFLARNITVREGAGKELDSSVISAVDLDIPRDSLMVSVIQPPRHGSIIEIPHPNDVMQYKRSTRSETPVERFTLDELKSGLAVMYMHDDSETQQDEFVLQLSDGKHQLQQHVLVEVFPVNDEEPQIVRNTGIEIYAGESRLISSAVLSAQDKDTLSSDILYVLENIPSQGVVQKKEGTDWLSMTAGMSCSQEVLNMNLLRYLHTGRPGARTTDFFVFHLWDGKNRSPAQHFYITVRELRKGDIALFLKPVRTSRGERVVITTDVLLAVDGTDKPEELLYIITAPPTHGTVEYIKHAGVQIQSFSQMDVVANLVCYVHDKSAARPKETIQFVVSNGKSTRNGTLEIMVELTDKFLPTLVRNNGLRVPQGSTITVSADALSLSDPDSPPTALTYSLIQPPQYGQLLLKGLPLATGGNFTQQHVLDLNVAYRHSGGASQIDHFRFSAADSSNRSFLLDGRVQTEPLYFTIQIEALHSSVPQVVLLETLWKVELLKDGRYGIFLSSREVKALDRNAADGNVTFQILRAPYFGYLENSTNGEFVKQSFSQKDLNRRNIIYILNSDLEVLTDSLEFVVSDAVGNTGQTHKLEFSWSSLELTRTEHVICESQTSVSLTLQRKGNLQDSSYVTVQVNELTASLGKDFIPASSLIQFGPGMAVQHWQAQIVPDGLEESDESFEVNLVSPVAAVLKGNTKATVVIKDQNGTCGETNSATGVQGRAGQPDLYPQHGTIHIETLPISQEYIRGDGEITAQPPNAAKKRLRVTGTQKVKPSETIRHGSEVIYTYHGITSLAVEEDDPGRNRTAQIKVTSRGQQRSVSGRRGSAVLFANAKPHITNTRPSSVNPALRPCSPQLNGFLHYNFSTGQLLRCNDQVWRPWTPSNEMVKAQKCPQGWTYHNNYCYVLSTEHKATWSTAARACRESFKGNLVSVSSKADMDWLWDFTERKPFWIGLNDRDSKGRWEWVGGEPVTYTNWRRAPPKSRKKRERKCVLVWKKTKWQTRDCKKGKGHRYVCYAHA